MFQDLNPLDRSTAFLEIGIMLLGAVIIGFLTAWLIQRARRKPGPSEPATDPTETLRKANAAIKRSKALQQEAQARADRVEKELEEMTAKYNAVSDPEASEKLKKTEARLNEAVAARMRIQQELDNLKEEKAKKKGKETDKAVPFTDPRVDKLQKEVAALTLQKKDLARKLEVAEAESENVEQVDRLQKELTALKAQNKELKRNLESSGKQVDPELERDLRKARVDLTQKAAEIATLQTKLIRAEGKLNDAIAAVEKIDVHALENEVDSLQKKVAGLEKDLAGKQQTVSERSDQVNNLLQELDEARTKIASLEAAVAAKGGSTGDATEIEWLRKEKEDQEAEITELEDRILSLEKDNAALRARIRDRSGNQSEKLLQKLEAERDALQNELQILRDGKASPAPETASKEAAEVSPKPDFSHLGKVKEGKEDDLTQINGIGPVVEGKLNELGIKTLKQVSKLTEEDMDRIDAALELFPGRVKREKWVKQARKLSKNK
jgi:predicted flap endonuclease-1-like 5' DNA nuclease